jgi:hypothetical protein
MIAARIRTGVECAVHADGSRTYRAVVDVTGAVERRYTGEWGESEAVAEARALEIARAIRALPIASQGRE